MSVIPSYLKNKAVEYGDMQTEQQFCLVEAIEEQTKAIERSREWQQRTAEALEEMVDRGNA